MERLCLIAEIGTVIRITEHGDSNRAMLHLFAKTLTELRDLPGVLRRFGTEAYRMWIDFGNAIIFNSAQ